MRQLKKALNRLGFYTPPHNDIGITGLTDNDLFDALRAYQASRGLHVTSQVKSDDETMIALNADLAAAPDGYYIWRTVGDDKVRGAHKEYEGTVRAWRDAPDPGEDYNCRCWAEAVKWKWCDFLSHYWKGQGKYVTLENIGLLNDVIDWSNRKVLPKVKEQVVHLVRRSLESEIIYRTENHYDFKEVSYPFGEAVVRTETKGKIKREGNKLIIDAETTFKFEDEFTDISDIREIWLETSSTDYEEFEKYKWSEFKGKAYMIRGQWKVKFRETLEF